ncbi:PapB/FocB family fimbrial expression transcriptional regulator [Escherichia coli]|uniref:PapB/FocB family fimbrial expression transcriptional regulator n=1 Tax=Escherichia coli TaxID=562 RepID=UPI0007C21EFC|nr:PapB/FocB family fimbrial expression transcriptional regulator [Escherichia coli]EEW5974068.1 transcriptional regulator [Escherichia coli]EEZ3920613.1 transcriptional regulator [Escherichia coli]EEZ3997395.1 transcriptional regulator [Escherichia coli]EFA5146960.1 transcriptional regulator [Escherichia coli]EFB2483850.1 transcriptional regulator [Escherichia coli]
MIKVLCPGYIEKDLFWFIIDVSPIRSKKMICALHDHLVEGHTRSEVCNRYDVNQGYLSVKIKEIHRLYEKTQSILASKSNITFSDSEM